MDLEPMLSLQNVETAYGHIKALKGISLEVPKGAIVTLLGANGAGKTTTLRTISGILTPVKGAITFEGKRVDRVPPERIVRRGLCQVPEGRELFPQLTVHENLLMGAYTRRDGDAIKRDLARTMDYFPILRERQKQMAGTLSGGEQQMLAIGRALMARPRLLMLDEPSLGLAPLIVEEIFGIIKRINEEGTTILLVEQNAGMALSIAAYGYVLETGQVALSGPAADLLRDDQVRRSYLGG